jgi:hypothetical protein
MHKQESAGIPSEDHARVNPHARSTAQLSGILARVTEIRGLDESEPMNLENPRENLEKPRVRVEGNNAG